MNVFPTDFEQRTGFDQIRALTKGKCHSSLGREWVDEMEFSVDHATITEELALTEEFRQILLSGVSFPSLDITDIRPVLERLRVPNTFAEPGELMEIAGVVQEALDVEESILQQPERYTRLKMAFGYSSGNADPVTHIPLRIGQVLDARGEVRDGASKELARIKREIGRLEVEVGKRMEQVFAASKRSGWVDEDAGVTLREGRLVIPFRSAHKRKIQGVVHDESATGQTVFVEPVELFEMNNRVRELRYAERREIIRILTSVADEIRPCFDELMEMIRALGLMDFVRAKARLAVDLGAGLCQRIEDHPFMQWEEAVHPLLFFTLRRLNRKPTPLSIHLSPDQRVLVISGPNAGGKSVCLKTVGLVQYMVQCGFLPPAREDSIFGIFEQIMLDIGDQQSLENDLSTYTSKLLNMKYFLGSLNGRSLFLIDEMGSGTDPAVGGAIAEAALRAMTATGAWGVVTTHYGNLKEMRANGHQPTATSHQPTANGAMLFDTRTLKPLFRLQQGKPGSSFAVEMARSIGFPEDVLVRAVSLTGGNQLDLERQVQQVEIEKLELKRRDEELEIADTLLHELLDKYNRLKSELELSKRTILEEAREEAGQILGDANKLVERVIKEIRESQADRERTKIARRQIEEAKSKITPSPKLATHDPKPETLDPQPEPPNPQPVTLDHPPSRAGSVTRSWLLDRQVQFSPRLDIRGMRVDEAFMALQRFMDDAVLFAGQEVQILHGKGTGALREVTREYLQSVQEVKRFGDAPLEQGGSGVTIATF